MNIDFLEEIPKNLQKIFSEINNDIIVVICKRLNHLQYEDIKKLNNALKYSTLDFQEIEKIIKRKSSLAKKEIDIFFENIAEKNLEFANTFFDAKKMNKITHFSEKDELSKLIYSIKKETNNFFKNISNTTGFSINGKLKSLREQYLFITDKASIALQTGTNDYYTALRQSVKDMAKSGVKRVFFESGYSRRLDSHLSLNVLEGAKRLTMDFQEILGEEYGADGIEITAHALCAPDHQNIQGKQFTKKEFENLNANLQRQIGTLNCKHIALPIILGVSSPAYSKKELENLNRQSNSIHSFKDKKYTFYEASQKQRKMETKIRKLKEEKLALKTFGDKIGEKFVEKEIKEKLELYYEFSEVLGLKPYEEKLKVYF